MEHEVPLPCSKSPPLVHILRKTYPVQPCDHVPLRFILVLFSHLRLDLPRGLLPFRFSTKILYTF